MGTSILAVPLAIYSVLEMDCTLANSQAESGHQDRLRLLLFSDLPYAPGLKL